MKIYGLYSTRNYKIRYVGKTKEKIEKRLKQHIRGAIKENQQTYKDKWIRKEISEGYSILIKEIETVSKELSNEKEKFWIRQFDNLTNMTEGGDGGACYKYHISYNEYKSWICQNAPNIKSKTQFYKFVKYNDLPDFLPKNPLEHFKSTGEWISWGDFLMTNRKQDNLKSLEYVNYNKAKRILKKYHLRSKTQFLELNKQEEFNKKYKIPNRPERYYLKRGWNGYDDFLSKIRNYPITYELFKRYINLYFSTEVYSHFSYRKNITKLPCSFPSQSKDLKIVFKNFDWNDVNKRFFTYKEAVEYLKDKQITSRKDYIEKINKNIIDKKLPLSPQYYYKNKGWRNWKFYLSNDNIKCKCCISLDVFVRYMKRYFPEIKGMYKYKTIFKEYNVSNKLPTRPDIVFKARLSEILA